MTTPDLDLAFAALADPQRRAILTRLASGPATVKDLAAPLPISPPAVTRHLNVLERAGLIRRGRQAQFRPCELAPGGLEAMRIWIDRTIEHWEGSFDKLADLVNPSNKEASDDRPA
jgi:DNA-binding transcriptional ArsR family regulator